LAFNGVCNQPAIDRLIHHAHVIEFSGESYRKKTHTHRLQEATHKPRH